jgi:K+-transporting ATPase KdpF subunit
MRAASAGSEGLQVIEALSLAVALGLGIYLVVTLIRPERF